MNRSENIRTDLIGQTLGSCRVEAVIGGGSSGWVFRAFQTELEKYVALKVLDPIQARSKELRERFFREARTAASIEHRNIIPVYDLGESGDFAYIVMQFLQGASLYRVVTREGIDQFLACRVIEQVADALEAVHQAGFVHRDVKPENIMLTHEGHAFLTDFSVATNIGTKSDPGKGGSPAYMSPEQCAGQVVDGRSDIYSLGATLYHLLTGRRPFLGTTASSLMLMHQQDRFPPVRSLKADVHRELALLAEQMLAKDKAGRPQRAADVVTALLAIQEELRALRRRAAMQVTRRDGRPASGRSGAYGRIQEQERELEDRVAEVEVGLLLAETAGEMQHAVGAVAETTTSDPQMPSSSRIAQLARKALGASRLDRALELIGEAIKLRPDDDKLYIIRANTHRRMGRLEAAECDYRQALSLNPASTRALASLGTCLRMLGRISDAENTLKEAVRQNPSAVDTRVALGRVYEHIGAGALARGEYEACLEYGPYDERGYVSLAAVQQSMGKRAEARALLFTTWMQNPGYPPTLYLMAVMAAEDGAVVAALDLLENAVKCGFRDVERWKAEAAFRGLANNPRYEAVRRALGG